MLLEYIYTTTNIESNHFSPSATYNKCTNNKNLDWKPKKYIYKLLD